MPRVKQAKIVAKKKSSTHERLHKQGLEGKKISMLDIKNKVFVPKMSTHTNNSLNVDNFQVQLNKSLGSPTSEVPKEITPKNNRGFDRRERLYALLLDNECTFQPDLTKSLRKSKSPKRFTTVTQGDEITGRNQFLNSGKSFTTL